ncbi:MAG: hypothetical protein EXR50_00785 [Dehalococcoidia bacterium]|nr:hypothetical protein [Dehalococcoidia bacterium]
MLSVDRYKGYSIFQLRDPNIYRVLDGKEIFTVVDDSTAHESFTLTAYYNQRLLLTIVNKEAKLFEMLRPAREEIKLKIDAGDLTDGFLHVGTRPLSRPV